MTTIRENIAKDLTFGEAIEILRRRKGLSNVQLAEICERSPQTVYSALRGNTTPSHRTVFRLATALDLDPLELVGMVAVEHADKQMYEDRRTTKKKKTRITDTNTKSMLHGTKSVI